MHAFSEKDLLLGAQRLDPNALGQIYNEYNSGLYVYAMYLLGDPDLAEECVSETFSRFLKAVYSGSGPQSHLKAYLYRIAHNWITDCFRRKAPVPLETIEDMPSDNDQLSLQNIVDKNIRQSRIRTALKQLIETQRQVIVLRFLEGWDNEEIASAISKPPSAIKSIQYRAIENLKKILAPEEAEE
jgi:RNA polymerase sigma-70 factor, ECF subfamily